MSEYYSFYGIEGGYGDYSPANYTSDQDGEPASAVEYIQAVFAFALGLSVYFCMLCNIWLKDGAITKSEVERSIVHKRVLAHGQSHCFDCDYKQDDECLKTHSCCGKVAKSCCPCRSVAQYCCRRKRMRAILPASTDDVKNSNRPDHPTTLSQTEECANTAGVDDEEPEQQQQHCTSELEQAEQGLVTIALDDEITCPICLEPLKLGEEVAWSKLKKCHHAYHYECITKWLFEGNMHCPVCRDRYWNRNYRKCDRGNGCTNLIYRKDSDSSDIMDARRYQFCEIHGLTLPSTDEVESATSCTRISSVLEV